MPTSVFDKTVNKKKLFKNTPPAEFSASLLKKLNALRPKDWLFQLEAICCKIKPELKNNIFERHLECRDRKQLHQQLSLIYYRLSGKLDEQLGKLDNEQKKRLVFELTEDIDQCTSGFRIRVNYIINALQAPQHLNELLYLTRKSILDEIATGIIYQVSQEYQIHFLNYLYKLTESDLGIKANIKNDPYAKRFAISANSQHSLKEQFAKQYTALKIPFLLTAQLEKFLLNQGNYYGAKEDGYSTGVAEKIVSFIKPLLAQTAIQCADWKDFFILDQLDEFEIPNRIYDVNWSFIRQFFLQKLKKENYFTQDPKAIDLLDCACHQELFSDQTTAIGTDILIQNYFAEKNYAGLLEQIQLVETQFPIYWQKLIANPRLIELIKQSITKENDCSTCSELIELNSLIEIMVMANSHEPISFSSVIDNYLQNVFTEKVDINFLNYLIHYKPDKVEFFFQNFLNGNTKKEDINALQQSLLSFNKNGSSFLCFAGRYQPKIMEIVLKFIEETISLFDEKKILKLFLSQNKDGWNLLSVVVLNQPAALKIVAAFITRHSKLFKDEVLNLFLTGEKYGYLLNIAAYYRPESLKALFELINKFKTFNEATLKKLFISVNADGYNLLTSFYHRPANVEAILDFITDHINLFDQATLEKLFLESNVGKNHRPQLSFDEQFQAEINILTSLNKYIEKRKNSPSNKQFTNCLVVILVHLLDILDKDLEKKLIRKSLFFLPKTSDHNAEKIVAAREFKNLLLKKGLPDLDTVRNLKKNYPAIVVGTLGQFYTIIVDACLIDQNAQAYSSNISESKLTASNEAQRACHPESNSLRRR